MEYIKTTLEEVGSIVPDIIAKQKEAIVYCIADDNCAVVGNNGHANMENIQKLGVKLVQINHEGGTIVLSPGDIDIGIFTEGYYGDILRNSVIDGIINKIKSNGYDVTYSNNDILVNGRKVASHGSRMFGKILYTAIHISININIDLIKAICTKEMVKIPDGLINYGINTNDILNIMSEVLEYKFT